MIHKEASNAYKYGIAYQIKKKITRKKNSHWKNCYVFCTCGLVS